MSETTAKTTIAVDDVNVGDVLRSRDGVEMTVTRIDLSFPLREGMIAFVEDSDRQWFKMPAQPGGEVELVKRAEA